MTATNALGTDTLRRGYTYVGALRATPLPPVDPAATRAQGYAALEAALHLWMRGAGPLARMDGETRYRVLRSIRNALGARTEPSGKR